ncbi:MAG: hypothetical protein IPK50_13785 [Fibrobacterota bacterium]|nr:MAG: hypothetical protein IPK50_13785 [Fibrobacterota bacterium]
MRSNVNENAKWSYEAYDEYAKTFRSWLIGFGVGISALVIGNKDVIEKLAKDDCLKQCLIGGLLCGIFSQVVLALINKYVNWLNYIAEDESLTGWKKSIPGWIVKQIWIDFLLDVLSIVSFSVATISLLNIVGVLKLFG